MQTAQKTRANDHEALWFLDTLVKIRVSASDGKDTISIIESAARFGNSPPLHVHLDEDEAFHIIEGTLRFRIDGKDVLADTGSTLLAPKGVPHSYRVDSPNGARWLTVTRNQSFESFVRAISRKADFDGIPEPLAPSPEQVRALAETAGKFAIEVIGPALT
jgi:quercetin dioxygenase-like cupin family protein